MTNGITLPGLLVIPAVGAWCVFPHSFPSVDVKKQYIPAVSRVLDVVHAGIFIL